MPHEAYRLVQLRNGGWSVHSLADSETMHPGLGPAAEAAALYVEQLRIVERLKQHQDEFVVWDVGLGAAANALAAIQACRRVPAKLQVVSFDSTTAPLRFGLRHCDRLEYLREYASQLEQLITLSRVQFKEDELRVHWQLKIGDFPALLARHHPRPKPHAIFFDPFSPAKNPAMWTQELFSSLFQGLDAGRPCALATYSRSTMVRVALLLAGFFVGRGRPSGVKEETTIAANAPDLIELALGRDWLKRIERSGGAEPLHGTTYSQAALRPATLKKLQAHPQFRGA